MSQILAQYPTALRSLAHLTRHPRHQAFILALAIVVGIGVAFYAVVEGWSIIDSFYFTIVALSTIGFGDLAPTTEASRLFTALYTIVGIGIIGTAVHLVVVNARAAVETASGDPTAARRTSEQDLG